MCGELQRLAEMNWPGTVLEPVIRHGDYSLPEGHPERDGLVGDLLVRGGVHSRQTDAIIDVQVIYLNAPPRVRRAQGKRGRPRGRGGQPAADSAEAAADVDFEQEEEEAGVEGEEKKVGSGGTEGDTCEKGWQEEERGREGKGSSAAQQTKVLDRAAAVLRTQEKGKELKHKTACEATRRDFVPFIVSTDGCLGEAAGREVGAGL